MKEEKYKIKWFSRKAGVRGESEPLFSKAEAARRVVTLNREHTDVHHWSARVP